MVFAMQARPAAAEDASAVPPTPQPPPQVTPVRRVLLVLDKPNDPLLERVRGEIAALGLAVVMRTHVGLLEEDARSQHAVAAIRVLPARNGVEVWMADETSGRSLLRQLIIDESPNGPDLSLIALQTAELIRTSMFPKSDKRVTAPPQPPAPPAPTPPTPSPPLPDIDGQRVRESGLRAGFGSLWSPGGVGPSLQLWVSMQQALSRRLGIGLDVSGPVRHGRLTGSEGSGHATTYFAGMELFLRWFPQARHWYAETGLCAALVRFAVEGQTKAPLLASTSVSTTGAGLLRLEAGWVGPRWLRIGATAFAGATSDKLVIRFAGNRAGTWGWPVLAAFLTVDLRWR